MLAGLLNSCQPPLFAMPLFALPLFAMPHP